MNMPKPLLIIINGPPGAGKTTLAQRLSGDLRLPVLHRDGIAETLFDGLDCPTHGRPVLFGPASFKLLHYFAGSLLAVGQSLIVEGSFYNSALASEEFLQLKQSYDFEPLQIQCKADGAVLLARFLARADMPERHICHRDFEFAERNKSLFQQGRLTNLALGGQIIEIDTTDVHTYDYTDLLQEIRSILLDADHSVESANSSSPTT